MQCRQFQLAVEEYWAQHPDQRSGALPDRLRHHAVRCRPCFRAAEQAIRSRVLLASLQSPGEPQPVPFFATRVQAHIAAEQNRRRDRSWRALRVAGRDMVLAGLLFATTLGTFLYNFQRTERPNIDEAMVLDVPHLNAQHPSDDHIRPKNADVLVSLFNQ